MSDVIIIAALKDGQSVVIHLIHWFFSLVD